MASSSVQQDLDALRSKGLAKKQRDKLKGCASAPITTPEMAQAFLASMRGKSKEVQKPPAQISADGYDAWYLQQKQREREVRRRRQEAEALLHGYRMTMSHQKMMSNHGEVDGRIDEMMPNVLFEEGEDDEHNFIPSEEGWTNFDGSNPNAVGKLNLNGYFDQEGWENNKQERDIGRLDLSSYKDGSNVDGTGTGEDGSGERMKNKKKVSIGPVHSSEIPNERDEDNEEEKKTEDDSLSTSSNTTPVRDSGGEEKKNNIAVPTPAKHLIPDETEWRSFVSLEPGAKFPPEVGRYHIYCSYADPGSHRVLMLRSLKGLEDVISVSIVHPVWRRTRPDDPDDGHRGWVFGNPIDGEPFPNANGRGGPFPPAYPGNDPDNVLGKNSIKEIYEQAGDTAMKYTVPILWDKKKNTIVNNESSDIAYMFNSRFNQFAKNPDTDLYTESDPEKLWEVDEWIQPLMINGVYRCGFAKTQPKYEKAITELTDAFDKADAVLQKQRFLTGSVLTDADIRLFATLIRFDEVYAFYFKTNTRLVMLTPSLLNYCRDIYQMDGIADTCDMDQIKAHFFGSHAEWNKFSIIPRGLGFMQFLEQPHSRDKLDE